MSQGTKRHYLGLDLGGTHVKVGVGSDGDLLWNDKSPSGATEGRPGVEEALIEAARRGLDWAESCAVEIVGVGVVSPGIIDRRGRVISAPANLPDWNDVDLAALFQERLQRAVAVDKGLPAVDLIGTYAVLAEHVEQALPASGAFGAEQDSRIGFR